MRLTAGGAGFSATHIVALLTGTGGNGSTYSVDVSQTAASGTMTADGTIGIASPANLYFYPAFYYTASPSTTAPFGTIAATSALTFGDMTTIVGAGSTGIGVARTGWGGSIGNVAMLYGAFPQTVRASQARLRSLLCARRRPISRASPARTE